MEREMKGEGKGGKERERKRGGEGDLKRDKRTKDNLINTVLYLPS